MASFTNILVETQGKVGIITFNRPEALNALCEELGRGCQLVRALENKLAWEVVAKFNPELI